MRRSGVPVVTFNPDRDKISRTHSIAAMFEGGLVFTLDEDWTKSVLDESGSFPYGKHDDIHDTCVQALMRIRDGFLVTHPDDPEDEDYEKEKIQSPKTNIITLNNRYRPFKHKPPISSRSSRKNTRRCRSNRLLRMLVSQICR